MGIHFFPSFLVIVPTEVAASSQGFNPADWQRAIDTLMTHPELKYRFIAAYGPELPLREIRILIDNRSPLERGYLNIHLSKPFPVYDDRAETDAVVCGVNWLKRHIVISGSTVPPAHRLVIARDSEITPAVIEGARLNSEKVVIIRLSSLTTACTDAA